MAVPSTCTFSSLRAASSPFASGLSRRAFSTTPPPRASVLFALNALSNSRETQHFNKLSHLSRVEHSPPLKLIQTSEIDPYPLPTPSPPRPLSRPPVGAHAPTVIWDDRALRLGRAMMTDHARQLHRLQHALAKSKQRERKKDEAMRKAQQSWQQEAKKLRGEVRSAGVWILLSIGTATALATWRFWPERNQVDSAELGRRIAARAAQSMPLPPATSMSTPVVGAQATQPTPSAPVTPTIPAISAQPTENTARKSWWRGLFWK